MRPLQRPLDAQARPVGVEIEGRPAERQQLPATQPAPRPERERHPVAASMASSNRATSSGVGIVSVGASIFGAVTPSDGLTVSTASGAP